MENLQQTQTLEGAYQNFYKELTEEIREQMRNLNVSQRQLASSTGLKQPAISRLLDVNSSSPQLNTLFKLLSAINLDIHLVDKDGIVTFERGTETEDPYVNFYANFRTNIQDKMKKVKLSQRQLAEVTGLKQPAISRLLDVNSSSPQLNTLYKVLEKLNLDIQLIQK